MDRIILTDNKDLQNQVKLQLIEAIVFNDLIEVGTENLICDAWDEKEDRMGKAFTGEQVLTIKIRKKK